MRSSGQAVLLPRASARIVSARLGGSRCPGPATGRPSPRRVTAPGYHGRVRRPAESGASRRRPSGKGGPSGIARGETAQVLTVASGRSADRSRATAMGRRQAAAVGRAGLADEACQGRVLAGATGVTDSPRSLRIFADHLSETAQVTDAGRLTCAGAAWGPSWLRSAGRPLGFSAYGSGINVGKDSRRAAWSTPSPIASVLPVNVRSARRRQERAHQRRWRRRQSRRSRPPHVVAGLPRWPPSGHLEVPIASPPRAARQGPCRGVS